MEPLDPASLPARPSQALRAVATRLAAAGCPSPEADARTLVAAAAETEPARLVLADDLTEPQRTRLVADVFRRCAREPLQHILGVAWWAGLPIPVAPGVFIPRPETELLVEWAHEELRHRTEPTGLVIDLCAGTGAVGLALAHQLPSIHVVGVERDPHAAAHARGVAEQTHRDLWPGGCLDILTADATDPALPGLLADFVDAPVVGRCVAVVSNPPYVPEGTPVDPEVRADPPAAVFAGAEGMSVIPALFAQSRRLLAPGGVVGVEHDDSTGDKVEAAAARAGLVDVVGHRDLTGRPRFVTARRPLKDTTASTPSAPPISPAHSEPPVPGPKGRLQ